MSDEHPKEPADGPSDSESARNSYADGSPFVPKARKPLLQRAVPVSGELPAYEGRTLRRDLLAGVTVAALAIPSGMAYAELAGLSPVAGLYALLLPALAYAAFGSSRQLVVGPEGSISALIATALLPLAANDPEAYASLAAVLALMVGACFLLARVLKLGWVADYFSRAVLIGYIHGVAFVLVIGQLGKLFGLDIEATEPIGQLLEFFKELPESSGATVTVSLLCLGSLLLLRRVDKRLPGPLIVVVGAIVASAALDLQSRGIAVVGEIARGLPSIRLPSMPEASDVPALMGAAAAIFFVSFADQILTARSFAGKHGQHIRADQELFAMGIANFAAGVTQAFSVGASGSRTAVNDQMGSRTQLSGVWAAGAVAMVLLFLTEPMQHLPKAALGAVIVAAAIGLVDPKAWRFLARSSRGDVVIAAITTTGVVLVGVLEALILAVLLSIVDVVRRGAKPHDAVLGWVERLGRYGDVSVHRHATIVPGIVVYRLDDRLFFANATYVKGRIREAVDGAANQVRWVVFDAESITQVDSTGVAALGEIIQELQGDGIGFAVARLKTGMRAMFDDAQLSDQIGDRFFPTVREAVDQVRTRQPTTERSTSDD
ncbi:MAG: sulfate permease [Microbacterium sp.]